MSVNKEVAEDYRGALGDLTQNSKPMITMLTMLAEENINYSSAIVNVIKEHILKTEYKLPAMYLVDSVAKNVGKEYIRFFSHILVQIFSTVFKSVDEKTRKKLYRLRLTWDNVFPKSRLYLLDVKINEISPSWPAPSQPHIGGLHQVPTIHVNPNKFNVPAAVHNASQPVPFSTSTRKDIEELHKILKEKKMIKEERKNMEKLLKQESKLAGAAHEKQESETIYIAPWRANQMFTSTSSKVSEESKSVPSRVPCLSSQSTELPKFSVQSRDPRLVKSSVQFYDACLNSKSVSKRDSSMNAKNFKYSNFKNTESYFKKEISKDMKETSEKVDLNILEKNIKKTVNSDKNKKLREIFEKNKRTEILRKIKKEKEILKKNKEEIDIMKEKRKEMEILDDERKDIGTFEKTDKEIEKIKKQAEEIEKTEKEGQEKMKNESLLKERKKNDFQETEKDILEKHKMKVETTEKSQREKENCGEIKDEKPNFSKKKKRRIEVDEKAEKEIEMALHKEKFSTVNIIQQLKENEKSKKSVHNQEVKEQIHMALHKEKKENEKSKNSLRDLKTEEIEIAIHKTEVMQPIKENEKCENLHTLKSTKEIEHKEIVVPQMEENEKSKKSLHNLDAKEKSDSTLHKEKVIQQKKKPKKSLHELEAQKEIEMALHKEKFSTVNIIQQLKGNKKPIENYELEAKEEIDKTLHKEKVVKQKKENEKSKNSVQELKAKEIEIAIHKTEVMQPIKENEKCENLHMLKSTKEIEHKEKVVPQMEENEKSKKSLHDLDAKEKSISALHKAKVIQQKKKPKKSLHELEAQKEIEMVLHKEKFSTVNIIQQLKGNKKPIESHELEAKDEIDKILHKENEKSVRNLHELEPKRKIRMTTHHEKFQQSKENKKSKESLLALGIKRKLDEAILSDTSEMVTEVNEKTNSDYSEAKLTLPELYSKKKDEQPISLDEMLVVDVDLRHLPKHKKVLPSLEINDARTPMTGFFGTKDIDYRQLRPQPSSHNEEIASSQCSTKSNDGQSQIEEGATNMTAAKRIKVDSPLQIDNISEIGNKRSPNAASWEKCQKKNPIVKECHQQTSKLEGSPHITIPPSTHTQKPLRKPGVPNPTRSSHRRQNRFQDPFQKRPSSILEDEWTGQSDLPNISEDVLKAVCRESETRSISIDNIQREIHTYGEKAIVLMNWDDPRIISFEPSRCNIVFDEGKFCINMSLGEDYREFIIDGKKHRVKLGTPSQELLIDGKGYQCIFGGKPITVHLAGKNRTIRLDGRLPRVDVSPVKNLDYLLGRIVLRIPKGKLINIYLDAKPQNFYVDRKAFVIKFINSFKSVSINGAQFPIEFGGPPISINVRGKIRNLHFSSLPNHVIPGKSTVRGMDSDGSILFPSYPPSPPRTMVEGQSNLSPTYPLFSIAASIPAEPNITPAFSNPPSIVPIPHASILQKVMGTTVAVDTLLSARPTPSIPPGTYMTRSLPASFEPPVKQSAELVSNIAAFPPALDITSLLGKLAESGLIGKKDVKKTAESSEEMKEEDFIDDLKDLPPILEMFKLEHLRKRNRHMIERLYRGLQCSSCGLRYPSDQLNQYSNHLDWHFRMNKKEQESAKKPNSRKYYHCINDWLQYEEIEDLDERVPSMFESQEKEGSSKEENKEESIQSIAVSSDSSLGVCPICHETFDQFYNQNTEEWHYKYAVAVDGINYHPNCHLDFIKTRERDQRLREELEAKKETERQRLLQKEEEQRMNKEEEKLREEESIQVGRADKEEETKEKNELVDDDVVMDDIEDYEIKIEVPEKKEKSYTEIIIDDGEDNIIDDEMESFISSEKEISPLYKKKHLRLERLKLLSLRPSVPYLPVRIKEEKEDSQMEFFVYNPTIPILSDIPIKVEVPDEVPLEPPVTVEVDDDETANPEIDQEPSSQVSSCLSTDIASSIDGNTEQLPPLVTSQSNSIVPKIKITVLAPGKNLNTEIKEMNGNASISEVKESIEKFIPPPFTVDLQLKPAFRGVELREQAFEQKGIEMSSLCSIM